jgi:hypothetical protein
MSVKIKYNGYETPVDGGYTATLPVKDKKMRSDIEVIVPDGNTDTTDATATAAQILEDEVAYVDGVRVVGTMPNNGYNLGDYGATLTTTFTRLELDGAYKGSVDINLEEKSVTPSTKVQEITPSEDHVLSKVTVAAVEEVEIWDGTGITKTEIIPTITFYIGNGSSAPRDYYAKEGMTWYEWCRDTNYNTLGATCAGEGDGHEVYVGNEKVRTSDGPVSGGQTITAGAEYTTQ